jgi:hypothetical protein
MMESEKEASGFATIALENHKSPWFRKDQIEKLGFRPLDSTTVVHKAKCLQAFKIYLMWMPNVKNAKPPTWNAQRLLEGISSCTAHPLYHPQTYDQRKFFENNRAGSCIEARSIRETPMFAAFAHLHGKRVVCSKSSDVFESIALISLKQS